MNRKAQRWHWVFIPVIPAVICLLFFLPRLQFRFDLDGFLPSESEAFHTLTEHQLAFGNDYDFFYVEMPWPGGRADKNALQQIRDLHAELKNQPEVEEIFSIAGQEIPVYHSGFWQQRPLVRSEHIEKDLEWVNKQSVWSGELLSKDGTRTAILVKTKDGISKRGSDELLRRTREMLRKQKLDDARIIGKIAAQEVIFDELPGMLRRLFVPGASLMLLVLLFYFKNIISSALMLLAASVPAFAWLGLLGLCAQPLDALQAVIPVILSAVALTAMIHLQLAYDREQPAEHVESIQKSYSGAGVPVMLSVLTTAFGFLSLVLLPIPAMRELGFWAAVGVIISGLWMLAMHPLLCRLKRGKNVPDPVRIFGQLKISPLMGTLVMLVLLSGLFFLKTDQYLLSDIHPGHSLAKSFREFDENFSGIRPFEAQVRGFDWKNQDEMRMLEKSAEQLSTHFETGRLMSVAEVLKLLNMGMNGGKTAQYRLPEDALRWHRLVEAAEKVGLEKWMKSWKLMAEDGVTLRLAGKVKDCGSATFLEKAESWEHQFQAETGIVITGTAFLADQSLKQIIMALRNGLLLSLVVVSLVFYFMGRSLRIVFISLIINVLPIAMTAGLISWSGMRVQLSNAIFFTVLLSVVIDDTLHVLWHFRKNMQAGEEPSEAIDHALASCGNALILTTLILIAGFSVCLFASFTAPFFLGLIMLTGSVSALFCDLKLGKFLVRNIYSVQKIIRK